VGADSHRSSARSGLMRTTGRSGGARMACRQQRTSNAGLEREGLRIGLGRLSWRNRKAFFLKKRTQSKTKTNAVENENERRRFGNGTQSFLETDAIVSASRCRRRGKGLRRKPQTDGAVSRGSGANPAASRPASDSSSANIVLFIKAAKDFSVKMKSLDDIVTHLYDSCQRSGMRLKKGCRRHAPTSGVRLARRAHGGRERRA